MTPPLNLHKFVTRSGDPNIKQKCTLSPQFFRYGSYYMIMMGSYCVREKFIYTQLVSSVQVQLKAYCQAHLKLQLQLQLEDGFALIS